MAMSRVVLITRAFVACVFSHQVSDVQRMGGNRRASAEGGVDRKLWDLLLLLPNDNSSSCHVCHELALPHADLRHRMYAGGDIEGCGTD